MNDNAIWDGFAHAVVRLDLPTGHVVLAPKPLGDIGLFPFGAPVHIVTAYNPAGIEIDEETSTRALHAVLDLARDEALTAYDASYLELALRLGLPLATKDAALRRAAAALGVRLLGA